MGFDFIEWANTIFIASIGGLQSNISPSSFVYCQCSNIYKHMIDYAQRLGIVLTCQLSHMFIE
jgi:hypothetical protein